MGAPAELALTYEDYVELPNDSKRYEVLDGELFVTPAPPTKHQKVLGKLFFHLTAHLQGRDLGEVRWAGQAALAEPKLFELERGDVLTTPLLPGLELSLQAVFE